jgi:3-phosphoshikimate 1-carboxyvinyltransferase
LTPPLSKSDAQRALLVASLRGLPLEDVAAGQEALPRDVAVLRAGLRALAHRDADIDCHDGGAPLRFLLGQAASAAGCTARFTGTRRLGERPHEPLLASLREALGPAGLAITRGSPWPLVVRAPPTLPPRVTFTVTGAESSQFASSLLFAAARVALASGRSSRVVVEGPLTSVGYLDLSVRWLRQGGFEVRQAGAGFEVGPGSAPAALPPAPGDWSSLGYLLLLAWRSGASVARVAFDTGHPDEVLVEVLQAAGLALHLGGDGRCSVSGTPRSGVDVDAERCPDAIPTLAVFATVLPEPSRFRRPGVLRHKESDRLAGIEALLSAAGLVASAEGAALRVTPGRARDFDFDARDDHRLAMSAAVLAHLHGVRARVRGKACVAKSFPGFWAEAAKVSLEVEEWT